ncbi:TonB-dependent receptor [Parvularcula dongshanensis]|uniref:TonB-dependent receptor n=1 Tax=Parvularcula dongshanensis TaxID=1173995 RepID=UPI00161D92BA|nr:TonB-dependent receptor [Parvularcula dongshanensis]
MTGASVLALGLVGSALAQDVEADDEVSTEVADDSDVIVVTGVKQALQNAQDIKRDADTIVDSITATDIGSFPDKSVAEALQRVAGITVNRFAASSDTAHFSAEPSGVIVRGLQQVRSEFNGRDTFSANSSRGLSWGDISPELMAGVDTYKNQMAELIEGGIAGTINLRTRVPFDQQGRLLALSGNANYNSLAESTTPEVSGLFSDRWETGIGEFGVMVNAAYSKVETKSEGIQLYRMNRFCNVDYLTADGRQVTYDAPGHAIYQDCNEDGTIDQASEGIFFIPGATIFRDNTYNRDRTGIAAAAQWQDNDRKWLATVQYNRSKYDQSWEEYVLSSLPADLSYGQSIFYIVQNADADGNPIPPQPAVGTGDFVFDDQGLFQSGVLTNDIGWWGNDNSGENALFLQNGEGEGLVNDCYGWDGCAPRARGADFQTVTRSNNNNNVTEDFGFNLKYAPVDNFRLNFDAQYVQSEVQNYDIEAALNSYADFALDITGDYPQAEFRPGTNINYSDGGLTNPANYYVKHIMDHVEDSEGDELALRGDAEYDFDNSGWLNSLKVGVRYADRNQTVRWSGYNWQNVANNWTQNADYASPLAGPVSQADLNPEIAGRFGPDGFLGYPGASGLENRIFDLDLGDSPVSPREYVFFDMDLMQDQEGFAAAYGAPALGFVSADGWWPTCSNGNGAGSERDDEIDGTCFRLAEIADVEEETLAAYAQLNFGGADAEIFGVPFSGNLGLRWVNTKNSSTGGIVVPQLPDGLRTEYQLAFEDDGTPVIDPLTGEQEYEPSGVTLDTTQLSFAEYQARACAPLPSRENQQTGVVERPSVGFTQACYLSEAQYNFLDNAQLNSTANSEYDRFLPSFNIKFDLTDEWLLRLAASRAMSRPDIGNLRNYLSFGARFPQGQGTDDPLYIRDGNGNITGIDIFYEGSAQNPFLLPVMATQFDVSLEHYFADVGSFSFAVFYKEFEDYIQVGRYLREIENNGTTETVEIRGPLNGDGASIQGLEVSYQRFFDFLPAPFDGLGFQGNYTYVDNQGIANSRVPNTGESGDGTDTAQLDAENSAVSVNALEGLSEHSFNLVGFYEKGPLALRAAYNWRSEYLVTVIDCCVASPIWTQDQGFLDASIRYRVSDNVELSVQGQNLLNTKTVTEQQVQNAEDGGFRLPTAKFQNDVRFTFGVRLKY